MQANLSNSKSISQKQQKLKNSKGLNRSRKSNNSGLKRSQLRRQNAHTSSKTFNKVIDFIRRTAEAQRKLQIVKQSLAEQQNFTPASLFYRLNPQRRKQITEKDIEDYLVDSKIEFKGSQLKTLFGRIDVNQNQTISMREFQDFILPNQNPKLRYETVRRPVVVPKPHESLSREIQILTARFFKQIIKQYSQLADINSTLKSSYDFNSQSVFQLLSGGTGAITGESIQNVLVSNGVHDIEAEEIGCLIKTMDREGNAKITAQHFDNFMATMGLKKTHQVFDELSPIPALKSAFEFGDKWAKEIGSGLKQRYKDNKSYVKGMDEQAHHIPGYSRVLDQNMTNSRATMKDSLRRVN